MGALSLPRELLAAIYAHAAEVAPEECVGLLFGYPGRVVKVLRLKNVSQTPQTRFFADPQTLFAALKEADASGERLLGSYHSHPHSDAFLSSADLEGMQGETVQLIVGRDTVRAFRVSGVGVEALELQEAST